MRSLGLFAVCVSLSLSCLAQIKIEAEEARNHLGEIVTVCARVFSARYLESAKTKPTLLNLGGAYPNQLLTVAIFDTDRNKFPFKPEEYYPNQEICVTGKLLEYKGSPEIIVQSPDQIKLYLNDNAMAGSSGKSSTSPSARKQKPLRSNQPTEDGAYDITLTHSVNLRAGPGSGFAPVSVLLPGSIVGVIKSHNGWSYVTVKKQVGEAGTANIGYIKNSVLK